MKWSLFFLFLPLFSFTQPLDCDILVINGKIIDGTGNNWYYGNIAVKNGMILKIGRDLDLPAGKIIDARGLIVAPGSIKFGPTLKAVRTGDRNATIVIL